MAHALLSVPYWEAERLSCAAAEALQDLVDEAAELGLIDEDPVAELAHATNAKVVAWVERQHSLLAELKVGHCISVLRKCLRSAETAP